MNISSIALVISGRDPSHVMAPYRPWVVALEGGEVHVPTACGVPKKRSRWTSLSIYIFVVVAAETEEEAAFAEEEEASATTADDDDDAAATPLPPSAAAAGAGGASNGDTADAAAEDGVAKKAVANAALTAAVLRKCNEVIDRIFTSA